MSTFFRGIKETVPSLFREIFSEQNSFPNPIYVQVPSGMTNVKCTSIMPREWQGCGSVLSYRYKFGSSISKKYWIRVLRFTMPHFQEKFQILIDFCITVYYFELLTKKCYFLSVWRIRDVYPGSRIRLFSILDPGST